MLACGTRNTAKLAATRSLIRRLGWPADLVPVDVPSGVPDQPVGEAQTRRGALGRARRALAEARADVGLGCEAGVTWRGGSAWLINWAAAVDRAGRRGIGRGLSVQLPPAAADLVRRGGSLGDWVRSAGATPEVDGAVGLLTSGLVSRQALWEAALAAALAPLLRPDLFGTGR